MPADVTQLPPDTRLPNHYIVVFKDSVEHPGNLANTQARQRNGKLGFVYRHALKGYSARLSPSAVKALRRDPKVKFIEPARKVEVTSQTTPTGVSRISAPTNEALDIDETDDVRVDADIAVIDTGVDYEHPDLSVVARTNCVPANEEESSVEECIDNSGSDPYGHGTHVAGIAGAIDNGFGVVGVAPGARIWSVRVLGSEGYGWTPWIVAGIDWVTAHASDIEVANMSLGGYGRSPAQEAAINASIEAGVVYTVAAGNDGLNALTHYPANTPDAITVSALTDSDGEPGGEGGKCRGPDDTTATFSNWGAIVDIAAPGACIYSTMPMGESYYGELFGKEYGSISGTSMAAPHVAGAAAIKASESNPNSKQDVLDIRYELVVDDASRDWTDTADDTHPEPLVYVGGEPLEEIEAMTGGWESVSSTSVKVYGGISRAYWGTSYKFQYGLTDEYGYGTETSYYINNGATPTQTLSNLKPEETYHYRIGAYASGGWVYGGDRTFSTSRWTKQSPSGVPKHTSDEWLNDIDCASGESCAAVGHYYDIETPPWNLLITYIQSGGSWSGVTAPVPSEGNFAELGGVSCTSSSACTAVGSVCTPVCTEESYEYLPLVERWNGSSWSIQSIPAPESSAENRWAELRNVSCPSANECIAVGTYKNSAGVFSNYSSRWNGSNWTTLSTPNPEGYTTSVLENVSCSSAGNCTAVGWANGSPGGKVVLRWNGSSWSSQTPAKSGSLLMGVDCLTNSFCVASGSGNVVETWDGEEWTSDPAPLPEGGEWGYLYDVSCLSTTSCSATGYYGHGPRTSAMTAVWDGTEWSTRLMPRATESRDWLFGISCVGGESAGCRTTGEIGAEIGDSLIETRPTWPPIATVQSASNYKPQQAQLNGKIEPNGLPTAYHFEWGTKAEYEAEEYNNSIPVPDGTAEGVGDVDVSETIEGLKGESEYHYRLVAESTEGSSTSADKGFTTPNWRPAVAVKAIGVDESSATLVAAIDPKGSATSYYLEWADEDEFKEEEYGHEIEGGSVGSGEGFVEVTEDLNDLQAHRTYHFRVIAENAEGSTVSEDATFTPSTSGFIADAYPATLHGKPQGSFQIGFGEHVATCEEPTFEAGLEKEGTEWYEGGAAILATTSVSGFECSGLVAFELEMNGCNFEFDPGEGHDGSFEGELNVGPPGCGPITSSTEACPFEIPAQVGAETTYENVDEGPAGEVEVDVQAILRYDSSGSIFCPAVTNGGAALAGTWMIEAEDEEGEPVDVSVTRAFEVGPEVITEGATEVGYTTATLHGSLDTLGDDSTYGFVYGTDTEYEGEGVYGGLVEGSEEGPTEKALTAEGLKPGTTYHYAMAGLGPNGISIGEDRTFTTSQKTITEPATDVGPENATLHGSIDPNGIETSFQFEYGTTTEYGSKAPASPEAIGSGSEFVEVEEPIEGLEPATTYHYRVVSTNAEEETHEGEDRTFTTWGEWSLQSTPNVEQATLETKLEAVSCPSSEVCVAAGTDLYSGKVTGQAWEEGEWQTVFEGEPLATVGGIDCPTTSFCMVVGEGPDGNAVGLRWSESGESWSSAPSFAVVAEGSSEPKANDVSCTSSTACTLVGSYKDEAGKRVPLVQTWSGGLFWAAQSTPEVEGNPEELRAVSCSSASFCVAVGSKEGGSSPLAMEWDGEEWTLLSPKAPEVGTPTLEDVSCASASFCMAAGSYKSGWERWAFTETYDGSSWTLEEAPKPEGAKSSALLGVSCASSSACSAAGRQVTASAIGELGISEEATLALNWSGAEWGVQSTPNPEGFKLPRLTDVDCSAANACGAVGWAKNASGSEVVTLGERWNGTAWSLQSTPNVEQSTLETKLEAVSCPGSEVCVAVGSDLYSGKATGQAWEGGEWQTIFEGPSALESPAGIDCPTASLCMIVGEGEDGPRGLRVSKVGEAWKGTGISFPEIPSGGSELKAKDVSCTSASACTLVGSFKNEAGKQVPLVQTWSGGVSWTDQSTPEVEGNPEELRAVSCSSASFCVAVGSKEGGSSPLAMEWDGEEWTLLSPKKQAEGTTTLEDVSCASASFCMAAGSYKSGWDRWAFTETYDGSSWALEEAPKPEGAKASSLLGVSCSAAGACTAAGRQVTASFSGELGISEEATMALYWSGAEWSVQSTPNPEGFKLPRLTDVDCSAANACGAVGWAKNAGKGEVVSLGERYE